MIAKARYLHGTLRRKSDRHKQEGRANYPGRSVWPAMCYRPREVTGWANRSQQRPDGVESA
ncbi:hypothetical protein DZC76_19925 [Pseudomonas sp. phDV1]|nr:hypothetical protein DZC76_19925 [Pseudomonas sp. phDV1]